MPNPNMFVSAGLTLGWQYSWRIHAWSPMTAAHDRRIHPPHHTASPPLIADALAVIAAHSAYLATLRRRRQSHSAGSPSNAPQRSCQNASHVQHCHAALFNMPNQALRRRVSPKSPLPCRTSPDMPLRRQALPRNPAGALPLSCQALPKSPLRHCSEHRRTSPLPPHMDMSMDTPLPSCPTRRLVYLKR